MSRAIAGVTGKIKQRMGNLYARTWKGVNILCFKTSGFNPRTALQVRHRAAIKTCTQYGALLNPRFLSVYMPSRYLGMSAYNWFVHRNFKAFYDTPNYHSVQYMSGPLTPCPRCSVSMWYHVNYARMWYIDEPDVFPPPGSWVEGFLYNPGLNILVPSRGPQPVLLNDFLEFMHPFSEEEPPWYGACWFFSKGEGGAITSVGNSRSS